MTELAKDGNKRTEDLSQASSSVDKAIEEMVRKWFGEPVIAVEDMIKALCIERETGMGGVKPHDPKTVALAKKLLKAEEGDPEGYHSVFDYIIEARLMELDPKLMKALNKMYAKSGEPRWYA